jgi:hypothetical protein
MSNQIVISSGAKVRALEGVLTGTAGIVNALGINVANGIPQLDGSGKILVSQLPNSVMEYKGSWNAATNTPTLVNGTGNAGDVYLCEVAGTVNFGAGPITFAVGDQVIYSGSIWQRASGATGTVTSVAVSRDGDALTITGSPITTSGTINIGFSGGNGQYINGEGDLVTFPSLTGFVPYTGATASVDLGIYSLSGSELIADGVGSVAGFLYLKQNTLISQYLADYSAIGAYSNGYVFNIATSSVSKQALLDLSSITASATRTYTLPDLSGTLAILEGSQTFSGSKTFSATTLLNTIYIDGVSYLKHQTSTSYIAGYTTYSAKANGVIEYFFPSSFKSVLDFNDASDYTYTFPAASGTIALTSDLSSYVPYTGATANVDLGTFDLTADVITGATGSFASSGGSDTFAINHSSGSGVALNITKGGNGEGLYINKTSGSGNAATIIGTLNATTLVKSGGTSSQFLKADGSVDSSTYLTTSAAASTYLPLAGGTLTGPLSGTSGTFSGSVTSNGVLVAGLANGNIRLKGSADGFLGAGETDGKLYVADWATGAKGLTILLSTGAATFSSSVTANSMKIEANAAASFLYFNNTAAPASNYIALGSGANELYFQVNGGDRMVIKDNGNVGIGTSSPPTKFAVKDGTDTVLQYYASGADGYLGMGNEAGSIGGGGKSFNLITGTQFTFSTAGSPRMTITSGGNVLIGTTSAGTDFTRTACATAGANVLGLVSTDDSSGAGFLVCRNSATTFIGGISRVGTTNAVAFETTSDYRLKEDLKEIKGLEKLSAIKVYDFKWKDNDARMDGVLAHELQEVLPYAVHGEKDAKEMQSVDYSKIVPVLVKAIQEQTQIIKNLEARIVSLESK